MGNYRQIHNFTNTFDPNWLEYTRAIPLDIEKDWQLQWRNHPDDFKTSRFHHYSDLLEYGDQIVQNNTQDDTEYGWTPTQPLGYNYVNTIETANYRAGHSLLPDIDFLHPIHLQASNILLKTRDPQKLTPRQQLTMIEEIITFLKSQSTWIGPLTHAKIAHQKILLIQMLMNSLISYITPPL